MIDKPYKILVVDDEVDLEPLVLQRMRRKIRSGTYNFVFAHNGIEALEVLTRDREIDMVLSDINMPQMDGLALLEQIPKVDPNLRAVIISAYGDMKNIRTAMNRGAFDFVTKPLDFKDLQVTIERTLQHLAEWKEALRSRDKLVALQNELDVASQMQRSILPTRFPSGDNYEVYGDMEAARNVGGDFFDVLNLHDDKVGLAVADVSDKGVPAALFMMSSRTLLKGSAIGYMDDVAGLMTELNNLLVEDNEASMFVTLFYGVFNPATGEFNYSNGGHNTPVIYHADGTTTLLPLTSGIALAVVPELDFEMNSVMLTPGDTLVLYTDGVTEAMNGSKEEFETSRLLKVFENNPPNNAQEANDAIFQAVRDFVGETPQSDDITCLTLHYQGPSS